jgi:hypothetical protein
MMNSEQRIQELEQRVRALSDIAICIPMAALALDLITEERYRETMLTPTQAMPLLEEIASKAELYQALSEALLVDVGGAARLVRMRRARIGARLAAVRRLPQPS